MKTKSATGKINNVYRLSICVYDSFSFGFEGGVWDLMLLVPEHCLSFCFTLNKAYLLHLTELLHSKFPRTYGFTALCLHS